jgi:hypothetical protein
MSGPLGGAIFYSWTPSGAVVTLQMAGNRLSS